MAALLWECIKPIKKAIKSYRKHDLIDLFEKKVTIDFFFTLSWSIINVISICLIYCNVVNMSVCLNVSVYMRWWNILISNDLRNVNNRMCCFLTVAAFSPKLQRLCGICQMVATLLQRVIIYLAAYRTLHDCCAHCSLYISG